MRKSAPQDRRDRLIGQGPPQLPPTIPSGRRPIQRSLGDSPVGAARAAEKERLKIARELEGDLARRLAALQLKANLVDQARGGRRDELFRQLRHDLRAASTSVRRLVHALRSPDFARISLATAIREEARRLLEPTAVDGMLDVDVGQGSYRPEVQLAVYRVMQEALRNALEHANASRIAVSLRAHLDDLQLIVQDDGCGFDRDAVDADGHAGLSGMRETALSVGGRLDVDSARGEGTRIRMWVPLDRHGLLRAASA